MHRIALLSVLTIVVNSVEPCIAQHANLMFEHYSTEQGLSAPVTIIAQDQFGFLWLGTTDGLNRFDGKNFVVFRNIPGDTTSIPSNIINALQADKSGRVWAATNRGLCYYDYADDRFHALQFDASKEKLDQYRVHAVSIAPDESVWFATRTMIHQLTNDKQIRTIPLPSDNDWLIKYLYADEENMVWIGTQDGIHVFFDETDRIVWEDIASPFSIENNVNATVHPIVPFKKDTVFTGSWYAGLQKAYVSRDSLVSIALPDPMETDPRRHIVSGVAPGRGSQWWIGTYGNGLAWFDTKLNCFTDHFHHNPAEARSLGDDYIHDIFTDKSGIVWIGTSKGLDKFDPLTQQFTSVTIPVPPNQFSVYRLANTIVEDMHNPGWLWICVSGVGLYHYHIPTQQFELYQMEKSNAAESHNNLHSFYYDDQQRVWIGTASGLKFFDDKSKAFKDVPVIGRNVLYAHTIFQDRHGDYWFATNSLGIYRYNEHTRALNSYSYRENDPNSLRDNKVFCMVQDSKGYIWIGTQSRGLCRLDPKTNSFIFFEHEKSNPNSIPDNGVYDLYEDQDNTLWIGTENGFAAIDMLTFNVTHYSTNDGLCNNTVLSITADHKRHLWLGTNNGLSHFDPFDKRFRNFYLNDGLPLNRIGGEVFFSRDNTLYFGSTGMLSFCKPEEMKTNSRVPEIVITDFSVLGEKAKVVGNAQGLAPIHLSYRQNMITFNFAALNFSNSFLNQYAYKLDGFDENWIQNGNKQSATYTNLDGGEYVFHVKGANNDGVWNEAGTTVLLYVHPPFWETWWFYALCVVFVAGILYSIYRIRINQLMRLQLIRARIARDLHDDIGSTLSSINMISSMADRRKEAGRKSAELFSTISTASGQALELMNDIVWSINPKNDRLEMILIRMRQYASETLEAAEITFNLEMPDEINHILLPLEIRKDFYLIFKEAVNNIAKYSRARHAKIKMAFHQQKLHLTIADDGVGFNTTQIMYGNGLKNMKARAQQLQGDITISSIPGAGTSIHLIVPLTP